MFSLPCITSAAALAVVAPALAVQPGFVEDFNNGTGGFGFIQGASVTTQLGGVGGASDGFLAIATSSVEPFAARAINVPQYSGDYITAGVDRIAFWLRDINAAETFVLRVGIGTQQNFWISNLGFDPGAAWTRHEVSLTNASSWTQVIGSGSFSAALSSVTVLQFRAAELPTGKAPDSVLGDIGVDRIALLPAPGTALVFAALPLGLRRRR